MENTETDTVLDTTTSELIKEAAIRAATGAIVVAVVTQLANFAISAGVKKYQARKAKKTTVPEQ